MKQKSESNYCMYLTYEIYSSLLSPRFSKKKFSWLCSMPCILLCLLIGLLIVGAIIGSVIGALFRSKTTTVTSTILTSKKTKKNEFIRITIQELCYF